MIIVVTGGRDYCNHDYIYHALNKLYQVHEVTGLIHGCASGVDTICGEWANEWMVPVYAFPADWGNVTAPGAVVKVNSAGKSYNALAGYWRNESMLNSDPKPTYGVVFPGGRGTADMKQRMIKAGLAVWEPYP